MLDKNKLKKLDAILDATINILDKEESGKHGASTASLIYEDGLNVILAKDSFKNLISERNKIKTTNITKSAKSLLIQFEDSGTISYLDFVDNVKSDIKNINPKSNLSPLKENVILKINEQFKSFALKMDAFYDSKVFDLFNQGRQHQTVLGANKAGFRKFASFGPDENRKVEVISVGLKEELMTYIGYLRDLVESDIDSCYALLYNKSEMVNYIDNELIKSSHDVKEIFKKHSWQIYSFGNLCQLQKDGVEYVTWHTGHHINDCLTCRAFETGNEILKDDVGNKLEYYANADIVFYKLNDVINVVGIQGPSFFCHAGCRCQFAEYNKKTSF